MTDLDFLHLQYWFFVVAAPLVALLTAAVFAYVRRHSPTAETQSLFWLALAAIGWSLFNMLEVIAPSPAATVFWAKTTYCFIAFTPLAWLSFALRYTNKYRWLAPSRFWLFSLIPLATTVIAFTNEAHWLLWQEYIFTPVGRLLAFNVMYGPWFWVHFAYSYLLIFAGAFLILRRALPSFAVYRGQAFWLVVGSLLPLLANVVYILRLVPALRKDYTSLTFAFAAIAFAIGMRRYQLFILQPLAREAMLDSMSDAMLALDAENRIVDLNPVAAGLVGAPPDLLLGRGVGDVLSMPHELRERLQARDGAGGEISVPLQGEIRHYDLQLSPLLNRRQQPQGRLAVLRDITERVQAERDLLQKTTELRQRNQDLDTFAHTVAHDLKSPLSAIKGYAELLDRYVLDDAKGAQFAKAIARSADKMGTIIDSLLLLSSVRTADAAVEPLAMAEIVDEVVDSFRQTVEDRQAAIVVAEQWPPALGYAPWVEVVWANYLSNALKYGGESARIELGATAPGGSGPFPRFWVRDNGPGISVEAQSQLFLLFSRLPDSMPQEGQGLGLPIVEHIIHKLGGEVGVESELGQGSLFWFSLPPTPESE